MGQCILNSNNTISSSCNVQNCAYCQNTNGTCNNCLPGYQLTVSGTCVTPTCNIQGCTLCSNNLQCKTCGNGYLLNSTSGTCYAIGFACNIQWCQTCTSNQSCGQCQLGYQLTPFSLGGNTAYLCTKISCPYSISNCNACTQNYDSIFQYNQILCGQNSCMTGYMNVNGYCVPNITSVAPVCSGTPNCVSCSYNNFCK